MNSDVLLRRMKGLTENITKVRRKINERDRWRSDSWDEDNLDHVYGYEFNYRNPYDTHQFPYPCYKECLTISSELMSKYQTQPKSRVADLGNPIRYPTQITRAVRKKDKNSPFEFSEIPGQPHLMPSGYTRRLPHFNANKDIYIETHLDTL